MSESTVSDDGRYWAFISYSHKDTAFGRRLHRRLESYSLPRRLAGSGALPRRLVPIFRDRDELPATQDLTAEVRAALKASRSLIVVCSPAAAVSPWVAREVELFRELHPGRPILAAIRQGEPKDALPPVLHLVRPDGEIVEPLAADFRRERDGWELGLLKLVAGVLGVGLDELVRRDSQRRTQRVTAVTAVALLAMVVMTVLTAFALSARSEAERQRSEAEGLLKFMHTDLRQELTGLGRPDLTAALNTRALRYIDHEAGELSPALKVQRTEVIRDIGDDFERHGRRDDALKLFQDAAQTTAAMLAEAPGDPERMFNHAQSEYWLGYDDYQRGLFASAQRHFLTYLALAQRMVKFSPNDPRYWRELSFAEGNLCTIALQPPMQARAALTLCLDALAHMKKAAQGHPPPVGIAVDLSDKESWVGTAYQDNGDDVHAVEHWATQQRILDGLLKADPFNVERRYEWISLQRDFARAEARTGHGDRARVRLQNALTVLDEMLLLDPQNKAWIRQRESVASELRILVGN